MLALQLRTAPPSSLLFRPIISLGPLLPQMTRPPRTAPSTTIQVSARAYSSFFAYSQSTTSILRSTFPFPSSSSSSSTSHSVSALQQQRHPTGRSQIQVRTFSATALLSGKRRTYNPSRKVQKRRHGFLARLRTRGGRKVLANRRLRGRKALTW